ncbi:glycoside hydrolase family 99-like domain-containing protein [Paracoccus sp. Z118]|uniref:glycoside hydrolase family 99-like domain-containing protein n=1 Tax=Paracoccus sp. Z118 TaxID=2851017 RepID=UPI001C2B7E6B|nr:glycoside hydrolase family 99-like domain-containing protein [Paracoccus sp. Z118]MBV0892629.1 glycoside hydrolase family 99-like domain-containing protein [Paracoccus sp. Z118]
MIRSKIHKIAGALRLLFPPPSDLVYLWKLRRSRLFDRQFYLGVNPNLHPLAKTFAERHFIQRGEPAGLQPNPEFSPNAYLRHNDDLRGVISRPFLHYIDFGRHEARITKDLPRTEAELPTALPVLRRHADGQECARPAVALVVHIYYHDLWAEISDALSRQNFDFDLFVTFSRFKGQDDTALQEQILADFPEALVVPMPNHGRDIFPFVHLVNSGLLSSYRAVGKVHTKKSPHRQDGEVWRRHLIAGILGEPDQTRQRLERFLALPEAAVWVADGQHYEDTKWWGSNRVLVEQMMARLGIRHDPDKLAFPAGSMYWLKAPMIDMIHGLQLTRDSFERELGQVDGTLAHAFERTLGYMAEAGNQRVVQTTELDQAGLPRNQTLRPSFVQAFYLPQFHPVRENDAWWGKGFTEWQGVARAKPAYPGHGQPALPTTLGFYDLRLTEVMGQQAAMARQAGIDAFCVYHYWFDGRRILERPIDSLLNSPEIDFPFYLCWANEAWRRNWDGLSGEILLDQPYSPGFARDLAQSLVRYFRDPRYQRPDGTRPRFVIYRPEDMPDPAAAVAEMRAAWREAGVGEVEMGAVRFHVPGDHPVPEDLFDFWVEMPPHGLVTGEDYLFGGPRGNLIGNGVDPGFSGLIYDYACLADNSTDSTYLAGLPKNTIAGIMPSWDNTARRGLGAHIAHGANPMRFQRWLRVLLGKRLAGSYRQEIFINAWNEWAEKAMLEPSDQYGDAVLRILRDHLRPEPATLPPKPPPLETMS